jgi:hypothetical protein
MKSRFAILAAVLLTSISPFALADDEDDELDELEKAYSRSGAFIREATEEEVRRTMESFNSTPTFQAFADCRVTAADRGHTVGHFMRDDGTVQKLGTEPQIAGLSFKLGSWTSGPRKGKADVFLYSQESNTALELGWLVDGAQQPNGHPTMMITVTALQTVGGQQQLLQQHTILLAMNIMPAPVYYTRTHVMRGDDAHLKKFMSMTTLSGTCTAVK